LQKGLSVSLKGSTFSVKKVDCGTPHSLKEVFYTYWRELRACFCTWKRN